MKPDVIVIGGGPAGLSCAFYLALKGYEPTVFEKNQELGGMLRYGIPSYRFPREKLDQEINSILSLGINVHTEVDVGKDVQFEELWERYDSVYISIGAHTDKKTGIPGEDSPGVVSAVEIPKRIAVTIKGVVAGKITLTSITLSFAPRTRAALINVSSTLITP